MSASITPTWLCFSSYLIASPLKGDIGHTFSLRCHGLLQHLLHYFNQKHGEEALCYSNVEANDNKAVFTPSVVQSYCLDTTSQKKLSVSARLAVALRLLTHCQGAKFLCQRILILFCGKALS